MASVCLYEGQPVGHYFVRFNHTASIWAERNLLLMGTYWPRNTHLEFVRLQTNKAGEVRVPRDYTTDEARPDWWCALSSSSSLITVRRWAGGDDRQRPGGSIGFPVSCWLLTCRDNWDRWIFDLDDLPATVPAGLIPAEWKWQGKTNGEIRKELTKPQVVAVLNSKAAKDVKLRSHRRPARLAHLDAG